MPKKGKIHVGPKGGRYRMKGGRRVYLSKSKKKRGAGRKKQGGSCGMPHGGRYYPYY